MFQGLDVVSLELICWWVVHVLGGFDRFVSYVLVYQCWLMVWWLFVVRSISFGL